MATYFFNKRVKLLLTDYLPTGRVKLRTVHSWTHGRMRFVFLRPGICLLYFTGVGPRQVLEFMRKFLEKEAIFSLRITVLGLKLS